MGKSYNWPWHHNFLWHPRRNVRIAISQKGLANFFWYAHQIEAFFAPVHAQVLFCMGKFFHLEKHSVWDYWNLTTLTTLIVKKIVIISGIRKLVKYTNEMNAVQATFRVSRNGAHVWTSYTGWHIRLFSRFCWHQNKSSILV